MSHEPSPHGASRKSEGGVIKPWLSGGLVAAIEVIRHGGNGRGLFAPLLAAIPVGGSPTGAGGSPAPPIFKTGS
jgi:hypothetical protein